MERELSEVVAAQSQLQEMARMMQALQHEVAQLRQSRAVALAPR